MPTQLVNLKINEVSGVGSPANMQKFLVVKSAEGTTPQEPKEAKEGIFKSLVRKLLGQPEGAKSFTQAYAYEVLDDFLSDQMWNAFYALKRSIESILEDDEVSDKMSSVNLTLSQFQSMVSTSLEQALITTQVTGVTKNAEETAQEEGNGLKITAEVLKGLPQEVAEEILKQLEAKPATTEPPKAEEGNDILKSLSPQVQDVIQKALDRATAAETVVKEMQKQAFEQTIVTKAAAFSAIPGEAKDIQEVLKTAYTVSEAQGQMMESILKAANDSILKGTLLKEVGSGASGEAGGDAWAKIEAKANEMVTKDAGVTREQAIAKAIQANPDLYQEYLKEMEG